MSLEQGFQNVIPQVSSNVAFEQGVSNFSFSIYDAVQKRGNEFISPYSISAALLLLMLGTDGTTKNQMMSSIFKSKYPSSVHQSYKVLNDKLERRTDTGVILSVANRLFGSQKFSLLTKYKSDALLYYGSEMNLMDFINRPEQARTKINNWIAQQTKDKIQDMLPRGVIDSGTAVVLVNAIYFKGAWKLPFEPKRTKKQNFFVALNVPKQVDMMHGNFKTNAGENSEFDCKVLQLPYKGDKLSMVFILPNDNNGLSQLETKLNHGTFEKLLNGLQKQQTIIRIPKFIMNAEYDLKPILSRLGITGIFGTGANFSKMVSPSLNSLYVSDARHKTFVEINEIGSEAAASTTVSMAMSGGFNTNPPFEFLADHPFVFFIRDNETGTIIFIGRFTGP